MFDKDEPDTPERVVREQIKIAEILEKMMEQGFTEVILENPTTGEQKVINLKTGETKEG